MIDPFEEDAAVLPVGEERVLVEQVFVRRDAKRRKVEDLHDDPEQGEDLLAIARDDLVRRDVHMLHVQLEVVENVLHVGQRVKARAAVFTLELRRREDLDQIEQHVPIGEILREILDRMPVVLERRQMVVDKLQEARDLYIVHAIMQLFNTSPCVIVVRRLLLLLLLL